MLAGWCYRVVTRLFRLAFQRRNYVDGSAASRKHDGSDNYERASFDRYDVTTCQFAFYSKPQNGNDKAKD